MSKEAMKLALEALEVATTPLAKDRQEVLRARAAIREALAEQPAQQWNAGVPSLYPEPEPGVSIKVEYEQPEFFTHNVEQPYDWSDWVCPDPKSYLMKCCDCGLVHEAQFGVVRYKSETEREDCDMVDDPNLQAVFRMRRSEQWSPEDMAHRAGGLPMAEQPAQQQEPVHVPVTDNTYNYAKNLAEAIFKQHFASDEHYSSGRIVWGVNDTVIGILTQIDNMVADMVRKPAQQEPAVWMYINRSTHETSFQKQMRSFVDHSQWKEVPLYSEPLANHEFQCVCGAVWCGDEMVHLPDKRPQPSKPWVGLTPEQAVDLYKATETDNRMVLIDAVEAKLRSKNEDRN